MSGLWLQFKMARGPRKHLKRISAPKHFMLRVPDQWEFFYYHVP